MRKITRITAQKRSKQRYNIFIDEGHGEKFGFSVDEDVFIQYHLRKGMELSEPMMEELLRADTFQKSYSDVIRYLSYRMRTKKEIIDYLEKKEVDSDHIPKVIEKLTSEKLIDDQEFANSFVRSRIKTTTKGPGLVKQELQVKGITSSIADEAIRQYDYSIQYKKAEKIAEKRSAKSKRYSINRQRQQLHAALTRNGFTQEVIQDVLANIQQNLDENEKEAVYYQGDRLLRKHSRKLSGYELKNKLKEALYRQGFNVESINEYLNDKVL